jgi:hypothetical protein
MLADDLEPVNLGDVRMIQCGERLRLAREARETLGIRRDSNGNSFKATSRASFVSRARYTSPIPPLPMRARISYAPRRVPGISATYSGR